MKSNTNADNDKQLTLMLMQTLYCYPVTLVLTLYCYHVTLVLTLYCYHVTLIEGEGEGGEASAGAGPWGAQGLNPNP